MVRGTPHAREVAAAKGTWTRCVLPGDEVAPAPLHRLLAQAPSVRDITKHAFLTTSTQFEGRQLPDLQGDPPDGRLEQGLQGATHYVTSRQQAKLVEAAGNGVDGHLKSRPFIGLLYTPRGNRIQRLDKADVCMIDTHGEADGHLAARCASSISHTDEQYGLHL